MQQHDNINTAEVWSKIKDLIVKTIIRYVSTTLFQWYYFEFNTIYYLLWFINKKLVQRVAYSFSELLLENFS